MGACEGLEHVVVRVDETRDHSVARSVEHPVHAGRRLTAASDKLDNRPAIGRQQPRHHSQCRGLARAIGP
jgi:hypothetical protein